VNVGKNASYFRMDISNNEEAQMYFGGVEAIVVGANEQFANNK